MTYAWTASANCAAVIGPYVFRNDEGENVTVNGERYRSMINNFLVPQLQGIDIADKWFQQDGATCHTAGQTIELLRETEASPEMDLWIGLPFMRFDPLR